MCQYICNHDEEKILTGLLTKVYSLKHKLSYGSAVLTADTYIIIIIIIILVNWVDTDNAVRTHLFVKQAPALPKRARSLLSTTVTPHAFFLGGLKILKLKYPYIFNITLTRLLALHSALCVFLSHESPHQILYIFQEIFHINQVYLLSLYSFKHFNPECLMFQVIWL